MKNKDSLMLPYKLLRKYGGLALKICMLFSNFRDCLTTQEMRRIVNKIGRDNIEYDEIKRILASKKMAHHTCDWCGEKCVLLVEHHYPIKRSKLGKETVNICGKCHTDFHHIESISLSEDKINYFTDMIDKNVELYDI